MLKLFLPLMLLAPVLAFSSTGPIDWTQGSLELDDLMTPDELAAELLEAPLSPPMEMPPSGLAPRVEVIVKKSKQKLKVFVDGRQWDSWIVSTGTEQEKCAPSKCYIARTPVGSWQPYQMYYTYTSRLWNARMDRAIFFTGGIALHATYGENIPKLGQRASGGCIRQHPENADLLYRLVKEVGMNNTLITVME